MNKKRLKEISNYRNDMILHNFYYEINQKRLAKASGKINYKKRMQLQKKATPKWANKFFIKEIYDLAKLRSKIFNKQFEVDHVIPINSKKVCGLHVENNLQILEKAQNRIKSNKF
jgi:hypothetical protein